MDITMVVPRLPGREETVTAEEGWIGPGGSAANYAVAVSRLGHRASLVSIAGVEASVLGVLEALRSEGVDLSYVRVTRDPGNVTVILLPPGRSSRTMISLRRASRI
ncbi:MAG: PfkB family carbohydrate kinase, partial [Desulfurococcales archaeon]|nr:PfkB family carbohydrate kinase [Desulfurococcales archaeon]